ncbi:hypothetical protein B0H15DRAFT_948237 [Mycena belliarum]|uniref:HAM1-like N-terminal domain-containing protein n=1 Tax=Mycena belliarum TaxID=1033014 RepID=A0AAD6XH11_9AGAR|nr:hypothetical protein B0H15DRAFT_954565 [Mycena belliae]KAJ7092051.1 hypothetical protein B0H15DRAFT_948237 [Mycena belliae]
MHKLVCFSPYAAKAAGDASTQDFTYKFSEVRADMRDVAFSFRANAWPIKMRDSGLADVVLGMGLEATVTVTSSEDTRRVFNDSKHNLLYKTLKPLAAPNSRRGSSNVQEAREEGVGDVLSWARIERDELQGV